MHKIGDKVTLNGSDAVITGTKQCGDKGLLYYLEAGGKRYCVWSQEVGPAAPTTSAKDMLDAGRGDEQEISKGI